MTSREERVRAVLAVGARIADAADPLGRAARARLPAATSLSNEGIELALDEHLEHEASDEEIAAFIGHAAEAPTTFAVLSANVCTAAIRAIAFAAATAPRVIVKASRRDPVVADLIVEGLREARAFEIELADRDASHIINPGDEFHVYGSDETIEVYARELPPIAVLRAHGSGLGAAIVGIEADLDAAAAALGRDVVPFDQAGCLSPRFALVAGGPARAERFAAALDRALENAGARVPRGELDAATRAELARYRATLRAVGTFCEGPNHAIGFDPSPRSIVLAPAARVVHVAAAEGEAAAALLAPFAKSLAAIGVIGTNSKPFVEAWPCRVSELGRMQKPPFDGPVDLRPYRPKPA